MPAAIVVMIRVRRVWRLRFVFWLVFLARALGIITSNDHAVAIAERLALRVLRFEIRQGQRWRPIRSWIRQ